MIGIGIERGHVYHSMDIVSRPISKQVAASKSQKMLRRHRMMFVVVQRKCYCNVFCAFSLYCTVFIY